MFMQNLVRANDPRMEDVYSHFPANLDDIVRTATDAGARVVLCTVAGNLKDCAPFASLHREGLSKADLAKWEGLFEQGIRLTEAGNLSEAVGKFTEAQAT